jgi:C1A family cysteine protease
MKTYIIILLFSYIFSQNSYINNQYFTYLKSHASFKVCPPEKNKFYHYTDEQIHSLFTLELTNSDYLSNPSKYNHLKYKPSSQNSRLEFDSRTNPEWIDYNCVPEIRDQGSCGSCWALSGATCLGWRFCIASKGIINKVLSPQYSVSCDKNNYGCDGGYLDKQWEFLQSNGLPTEECYPYVSGNGTTTECIENKCEDGSEWKTYKSLIARNYVGDAVIRDVI